MRANACLALLGLGGCCLEVVSGDAGFTIGGQSSLTGTGTSVVTSSGSAGERSSSGGSSSAGSGTSGASTGSEISSGGSTTGSMDCTIDGQSYPARAFNPSNAAECCNPALSRSAWQPLFIKTLSFPVPSGNGQIDGAVGDLNQDGIADVVLVTHTEEYTNTSPSAQVWLYLSKSGSYSGPFMYDTQQFQGSGVAIGDLNGDGLPDVIVTTSAGLDVFMNLGGGRLGSESSYPLPHDYCENVGPPRLIDANSDGWLDVVVATQICGHYVYTNDAKGGGGLHSAVEIVGDPRLVNPSRNLMTVGHFNGDEYQDLTCSVASQLGWFVQTGNGFGYAVTFKEPSGDWIDLATVSTGQGDAVVAANGSVVDVLPPSNTGPGAPVSYPVDQGGGTIAVADVNGDGAPDLLIASIDAADAGSSTVDVLLNQGGAQFGPTGSLPVPGAESDSIARIGAGDLNGDGVPDMALIWSNGPWEVWINDCGPGVK